MTTNFHRILAHVGHKIVCIAFSLTGNEDKATAHASIVCDDCDEGLCSATNPEIVKMVAWPQENMK